jgi:UDPglucose 6-dehydrogenase
MKSAKPYTILVSSLLLLSSLCVHAHKTPLITVIGTGYVGLVSGACLAEIGNSVICADIDSSKINSLKNGIMPIYELGLTEIVMHNVTQGRLTFTDDVASAITAADIIFIAVGTPMADDGKADLSYIDDVIETIAENINSYKIIVTKSTVPVGTGKKIRARLENVFHINPQLFSMASNPEFLREGLAVSDFLEPDRLVIGTDSDTALVTLCEIYEPLIAAGIKYVLTDIQTAEMIKYASNGFLSVKISYINEIANLCDATQADVRTVAYTMGLDHRISPYFLNPGPGFGGSCFPKDSQALVYIAQQEGLPFSTLQGALDANRVQQKKAVEKLSRLVNDYNNETLLGKTIAVLGLSFKANTDDVRYSPSISTINELLAQGAFVKVYDPIAMPNMQRIFPSITYCQTLYEAAQDADGIIIMTDWDEIKQMNLAHIKQLMNQPLLVDARNIINPEILKQLGFTCDNIGQSYLCKKQTEYVHKLVPIHLHRRMPFIKFCTK